MITSGPTLAMLRGGAVSRGSLYPVLLSAFDDKSDVTPFFWQVKSNDDLKPVVHAKYDSSWGQPHLWDGVYNGVPFRASTIHQANHNNGQAWYCEPGWTFMCNANSIDANAQSANHQIYYTDANGKRRYGFGFTVYVEVVQYALTHYTGTFDSYAAVGWWGWVGIILGGRSKVYIQRTVTEWPHLEGLAPRIADYITTCGILDRCTGWIDGTMNLKGPHRTHEALSNLCVDYFVNLPVRAISGKSMDYGRYPRFQTLAARNENLASAFILNEDYIPISGSPHRPGFDPRTYWLNVARSEAFANACDNMPALSDNSISNLQEVLEFILSVVRREPLKIPTALNEAWLAYRYQYSTTKMDVKEALAFVNRYYDLESMFVKGIAHGEYHFTYQGIDVTCRCAVEVSPGYNRWYNNLATLWRDLSTLGLAPDLYYLWDSTPFSFIVDWFLPIGDMLEAVDASMLYTTENYKFGRVVYSLSYCREDGFAIPVRCYSRWVENSTPAISPMYRLENRGSASKRQVAYRALDAASLIIGGIK